MKRLPVRVPPGPSPKHRVTTKVVGVEIAIDPVTLAVVLSLELTILYLLFGVRKTTEPLYPMMGAMGGLSPRESVLLGRFLRRQLRGDGTSMGILQREEERIRVGLEPEVPD